MHYNDLIALVKQQSRELKELHNRVELLTQVLTIDEIIETPVEPEDPNMGRCRRFLDSLPRIANRKRSS